MSRASSASVKYMISVACPSVCSTILNISGSLRSPLLIPKLYSRLDGMSRGLYKNLGLTSRRRRPEDRAPLRRLVHRRVDRSCGGRGVAEQLLHGAQVLALVV